MFLCLLHRVEVLGFSREVASGLECWCIEAWEGLGLSFPPRKPATSSGSLDGESRMQAAGQEGKEEGHCLDYQSAPSRPVRCDWWSLAGA